MSWWQYILLGWVAGQPVFCIGWARIMKSRRALGGN